jgi:sigma-B regulation protein RsbU (phosphoserine phosphatase)
MTLVQTKGAGYLAAVAGIAVVTATGVLLRSHINDMTVALAMLLVVLVVASEWQREPAVLASGLAVLCLNYYFLAPLYSFRIGDPRNWIALGAFLMTAFTVGELSLLASRRRVEAEAGREQAREASAYQALVADLGLQALRRDPFGKMLDEALAQLTDVLGVDYARVLELLPDRKTLVLRAGVGWKPGVVGQATVAIDADSQAGFTLSAGGPVILEDLCTEQRFHTVPMFGDPPVVSGMSIVIATSAGPYGILSVHTRQRRFFTKEEVNFLQSVANVLGTIIERRQAEEELLHVNRAHRALSACNEALVRATDESALLQEVCRIIVQEAGYRFSWVGHAEHDEAKSVTPLAYAGVEDGYLKTLGITWADAERGRGPTGTCIRTRETVVAKNIATDPSMIPCRAEALKRGYASSISIPLMFNSTVFGALIIYAAEPEAFGVEEVRLLTELASDLAFGIGTLRTRAERARAEVALLVREREIELGSRIQQTLLLDQPPELPAFRVAALTVPSQRIDGDFYIFVRHSDACLDVIVGDVMGKGIPAALLGAATKSHFLKALNSLMGSTKDGQLPAPKDVVMLAHAELVPRLIDLESFVTLTYARLDETRRALDLVDCGHPGLLHWHAKAARGEMLHGDNLPLGVREGEIYDQMTVPFDPGDLFLFFSDGITEARDSSREVFGAERLEACVAANGQLPPADLVAAIRKAVFTFSDSNRLTDDLTAVAIRMGERQFPVAHAELEIGSALTHLRQAREFVRRFCRGLPGDPLDEESVSALELAVNEATSNIMKHAFQGRPDRRIHLEAEAFPGHVSIRLHHVGDPFNPAAAPPPPLDGSRESGFGVYLISRSVDEVRYCRDERGRHCIALVKHRRPKA